MQTSDKQGIFVSKFYDIIFTEHENAFETKYNNSINISELFRSDSFKYAYSPLILAFGEDVHKNPTHADLLEMTHLLICNAHSKQQQSIVHTLILSLLMKSEGAKINFLFLDNLGDCLDCFSSLNQLVAPIEYDTQTCLEKLSWLCDEVKRRLALKHAKVHLIIMQHQEEEHLERFIQINFPCRAVFQKIYSVNSCIADLMLNLYPHGRYALQSALLDKNFVDYIITKIV